MSWAFVFMGAELLRKLRRAAILAGLAIVAVVGVVALLWGEP